MKLTKQESQLIIDLLLAQTRTIGFLRGFAKPTQDEQYQNGYFNKLIEKIKGLTV